MGGVNIALTELLAVVERYKTQVVSAGGSPASGAIDTKYWDQLLFIIHLGDYAAGNDGTFTAGVYGDTASGGSFTNLITGKQITAASFTGSTGDDAIALIHVRTQDAAAQGYRYLKLKMAVANQDLPLSVVVLGCGRYEPADDFDIAAVREIIEG